MDKLSNQQKTGALIILLCLLLIAGFFYYVMPVWYIHLAIYAFLGLIISGFYLIVFFEPK